MASVFFFPPFPPINIDLPHRFKIAIGGCPNDCAKINLCEVAILAQQIPYFKEDMCKGCSKCSIVFAKRSLG